MHKSGFNSQNPQSRVVTNYNPSKKARSKTVTLTSLLLLMCGILLNQTLGQIFDDTAKSTTKISNPEDQVLDIIQTTMRSSAILSDSQGSQAEGAAEHMILNGKNGLQLEISLPAAAQFNYTVMFWFRSHLSTAEITHVTGTQRFTLFELQGGAGCYVEGTTLKCNPEAPLTQDVTNEQEGDINIKRGSLFELDLRRLPDLKQWTHLTYSAFYATPQTE